MFQKLWQKGLVEYDEIKGIDWKWEAADGAMNKAPLGCEKTGPNPTDRGKMGVKRSLLVDGNGVPLSIVIAGANVNDHLLLEETLQNIQAKRGLWGRMLEYIGISKRNLCLDKGYDNKSTRALLVERGHIGHIRSRGEEKVKMTGDKKARRWVVEVCHSWLNRFRKILVRLKS